MPSGDNMFQRVRQAMDRLEDELIMGAIHPPSPQTTADHANRYLATNLTAETVRQVMYQVENTAAADDADTFLRLGPDAYKLHRILQNGGILIIGGHRRGGSVGERTLHDLWRIAPTVRAHLTEFLADGKIIAMPGDSACLTNY